MAGDKRVQTEMGDLLSRARNTMGAHNFNTLQQELRRQRNAYGKVRHGPSGLPPNQRDNP